MKKYNKTVSWISPLKIGLPCFVCAIILNIISAFLYKSQEHNYQTFIPILLYISCILYLFSYCIICIPCAFKYTYTDTSIVFKCYNVPYRRLKYDEISSIIISNAVQIVSFDSRPFDIPLYQYYNKNNVVQKKQYPYISLLTSDIELHKIKKGMNCRLIRRQISNSICLGICYFDSLKDLINRTDVHLYILEDVYHRYKDEFDVIMQNYSENNKFHIVSNGY